ncbi:hypothetical protein [Bacillus pumilus]|nr:hypothetical protein [Bacillus pumilus]
MVQDGQVIQMEEDREIQLT